MNFDANIPPSEIFLAGVRRSQRHDRRSYRSSQGLRDFRGRQYQFPPEALAGKGELSAEEM